VNGLRVLIDDKSYIEMADSIVEGGVAEIYVVDPDIIELPNDDLQHDGQNSSRKRLVPSLKVGRKLRDKFSL